ncbi:MAG: SDR family NAD(P)-dependent oxidoreductase [Trueperaceae bacterium]|nr:SDR family NAD(P)-dependent oxidoreductase [Trueperaceae bacterium]
MKTLKDKAIVITGAGGDIAGAVEEAMAQAGARPILIDRDEIRIRGRAESYATLAIEEDLLSAESAQRAADAAQDRMGRVDGLVHLIGDIVPGRLEDLDDADYDHAFDSNVRTLFHTVRAFLPLLKARPESFVASIGAQQAFQGGSPGATVFAAAKGAAATMLRSLDAELADTSVDVTIITPLGPVDTGSGRTRLPAPRQGGWISPRALAAAFVSAALAGEGGRLLEVPIHPPR